MSVVGLDTSIRTGACRNWAFQRHFQPTVPCIGRFGRTLIALLAVLCLSSTSNADETTEQIELYADKWHANFSNQVTNAAASIDAFFDNANYLDETNETSLRIAIGTFYEEGSGLDFTNNVNLRLKLPHTENRLQLFLFSDAEDTGTNQDVLVPPSPADEQDRVVGVSYYLKQVKNINLSLRGGARLHSGTPVFFVQPRYRYFTELEEWDMRFIQKITWWTDTGWDARSNLQFERPLSEQYFFRTTGQIDWFEEDEGLFPALGFDLNRIISKKRAISLQLWNTFETEPDAVWDSSTITLRYRQQFWRKWLYFDIAPQVRFPRDHDYEALAGILFQVEANFGKYD